MISVLLYCIPFFLVSCGLCFLLIRFPLSRLQDKSGDRSLHQGIIPRSGGIALSIAFIAGLILMSGQMLGVFSNHLLIIVILMCIISLLDDVFSLSPLMRFLFQLFIASYIVFIEQLYFAFNDVFPVLLCQLLTVAGLIWMINLYNFMDGMDGFASGMAMIAFTTLAVLGYAQDDRGYVFLNLLLVFAVSGFWCFNFPPAKIFMGDMGSTLLGLLAGLISLIGWQRGLFPLWVPAILFSPFWVDATWTVLKRMYRREPFWLPHRSHFYQRLVLKGLGHKRVVLGEYLLMLLCSLSILLPLWAGLGYNLAIPFGWVLLYIIDLPLLEAAIKKTQTK